MTRRDQVKVTHPITTAVYTQLLMTLCIAVGNGRPTILFNNSLSLAEQKASLAHEFAHHVLGHIPNANPQGNSADVQEHEAEIFSLFFYFSQNRPLDETFEFLEENEELRHLLYAYGGSLLFCLLAAGAFKLTARILAK